MVLEIDTGLPVRSGVNLENTELRADGDEALIIMSGQTMSELANWAMAEGRLPRRFNRDGRAREDGAFEAALAWGDGNRRPLRIHLWRMEPRCLRAVLAARPEFGVEDDEISLDVEDATVVELEGPPMERIARWVARLWLRAAELTQSTASTLEFSVGGRSLRGRVTGVERDGDELRMSLALVDT